MDFFLIGELVLLRSRESVLDLVEPLEAVLEFRLALESLGATFAFSGGGLTAGGLLKLPPFFSISFFISQRAAVMNSANETRPSSSSSMDSLNAFSCIGDI